MNWILQNYCKFNQNIYNELNSAKNHSGGYGPGTVDIFRQNMDMEKLSFENVDVDKINRDMELETRINFSDTKQTKQGKKQAYSDFVID